MPDQVRPRTQTKEEIAAEARQFELTEAAKYVTMTARAITNGPSEGLAVLACAIGNMIAGECAQRDDAFEGLLTSVQRKISETAREGWRRRNLPPEDEV